MSESFRSFIAFDIGNNVVLDRMEIVQKLLLRTGADIRLVKTQNIHITIRFLGNITQRILEKVTETMQKTTFSPFNIQVKGLGTFPNLRNSRIIWAGITEGADQLKNIFLQLEPRLRALGFSPDLKGFNPHLTIARVRSGRNKLQLADFIRKNVNHEFGTTKATCLLLKKSVLTPRGPIYSKLSEFCPKEQLKRFYP